MSLDQESLGERLRLLRVQQGLSLEQLAQKSEVSAGFLSQVERGKGNPSYATLSRITAALSVPLATLFTDGEPSRVEDIVVRRGTGPTLRLNDRDLTYEFLTPPNSIELVLARIEIGPGVWTRDRLEGHRGVEAGIVLQGTLEIELNGRIIRLEEGDSASFESQIPHRYHNPGPTRTIVIWAQSPWAMNAIGQVLERVAGVEPGP